jgi:carbon monoxide dehydrogenase subunit G
VELTNEFTMAVPLDEAWAILTDVERIAPCMPGAQLQEVEGDEYRGVVKVKVGPITAQYKGVASFVEQEAPTRAVLRAEGREARGQGRANATITAVLVDGGDSTTVTLTTDLAITGKVAQFGRSMLADVSGSLVDQFVACLGSTLLVSDTQVTTSAGGDAGVADEPGSAPHAESPVPTAEVGGPMADGSPGAAPPAARRIEGPEAEPVDLLATGGTPVAKRVAPVAAVLAALWLLRLFLRRRRRT